MKSTPSYDFIELNRRKTLLWGLVAGGVPLCQLLQYDKRRGERHFRRCARWRFVAEAGLGVL